MDTFIRGGFYIPLVAFAAMAVWLIMRDRRLSTELLANKDRLSVLEAESLNKKLKGGRVSLFILGTLATMVVGAYFNLLARIG